MSINEIKIEKVFNECEKHILRMQSAITKMSSFMPLTSQKYINLSDDEVEHIDQFLFRFTKLQDTLGEKLFKSILLFVDEQVENKPFIDILNRLEKLGLIDSTNEFRELRNDRNELAHNYDDEADEMSATINKLYTKQIILVEIYKNITMYYDKQRV